MRAKPVIPVAPAAPGGGGWLAQPRVVDAQAQAWARTVSRLDRAALTLGIVSCLSLGLMRRTSTAHAGQMALVMCWVFTNMAGTILTFRGSVRARTSAVVHCAALVASWYVARHVLNDDELVTLALKFKVWLAAAVQFVPLAYGRGWLRRFDFGVGVGVGRTNAAGGATTEEEEIPLDFEIEIVAEPVDAHREEELVLFADDQEEDDDEPLA